MSLRLRLTLIYTALVSGVVLLLSIVIFSIVSVVLVNQVDSCLHHTVDQIIKVLRLDPVKGIDLNTSYLRINEKFYYQIWSNNGQLMIYSDSASQFSDALDPESFDQMRFSSVNINQERYRVLSVPLVVDGEAYGWLQVAHIMTEVEYTQRLFLIVFGISAVFSIIVAVLLGWLVTGQTLKPLATMSEITRDITNTDDLSKRIPVKPGRNDEVNTLALTFNHTLVRLERLFNAQRRFLTDVSHELRTPLTVIKGNVGLMRIMKNYDEESLKSIESEVDRLTRLVQDLLLMAQAETGKLPLMMDAVEIDDLLFEVFEEMKVLSEGQHNIGIENIEPATVFGDRDRLKQVLINLGGNAVKYTPEGGNIELSLFVRRNWAQIRFKDEGYGIPKEDLSRLFERFYRGDKSRTRTKREGGFGLGLPIAYWIVRSHGGRIEVDTEVGRGTTFTVWLPLSQAEIPTRPMHSKKTLTNE